MTNKFMASIKNETTGSWFISMTYPSKKIRVWTKSKIIHSFTEGLRKEERHIFRNKKEAQSTLKVLQSISPDTFILVIETPISI